MGVTIAWRAGFEILPQVHTAAYAVAAESLFQGWNAGRKAYRAVPQADRDWILAQLAGLEVNAGLGCARQSR